MNWHDFLTYLGIRIPDLLAGLFGGVVKALVFNREQPVETVFSGIVGALTANYLGTWIAGKLGAQDAIGAVCFAIGIAAMVICQAIIERAKALTKSRADA